MTWRNQLNGAVTVFAFAILGVLPAAALHEEGCVPGRVDPSTLNWVMVGDLLVYVEERGNPLGTDPPVPLSGFILGGGTWVWQETNGLPGLQRGGIGLIPPCLPLIPCLIVDEDYYGTNDENCRHGPDKLWF